MADAAPASSPVAPTTSNAPASPGGAAPAVATPPMDGGGSASQPATPPAPPKTWALKFGDKTEELTEEQLVHRAQKAHGAEQKFREAAEIQKQHAEFKEALADPMKAREYIRKHGGDPDAFLKSWALDWHQQQEMTPEQKDHAAREAKLSEREQAIQAQETQRANAEFQQRAQQAHGTLVEKFSTVLAKVAGPDAKAENVSPRLLQAMANYEQANRVTGTNAPPEVVAQETIETAIGDGVAALSLYEAQPAALVKYLGPKLVAAIINEVVRMEDERAGVPRPVQSRPVLVNGNGHDRPRNGDGTFKPSGRESREQASFNRFISGGGV
jgi:hypothetical protein